MACGFCAHGRGPRENIVLLLRSVLAGAPGYPDPRLLRPTTLEHDSLQAVRPLVTRMPHRRRSYKTTMLEPRSPSAEPQTRHGRDFLEAGFSKGLGNHH